MSISIRDDVTRAATSNPCFFHLFEYSTVLSEMNFWLYFIKVDSWALGFYCSQLAQLIHFLCQYSTGQLSLLQNYCLWFQLTVFIKFWSQQIKLNTLCKQVIGKVEGCCQLKQSLAEDYTQDYCLTKSCDRVSLAFLAHCKINVINTKIAPLIDKRHKVDRTTATLLDILTNVPMHCCQMGY